MAASNFQEHFSMIEDPRQEWKIAHKLYDIIFLTVCAVIGGCDGWDEIEDFGEDWFDWLKGYGDFSNGVPSRDTIARTMSRIDADQLQRTFIAWMQSCHQNTDGAVIAIDGKTVRRSFDKSRDKGPIHMVNAFCTANQQVLGQCKTEEKSNEITAIPELLKLLDVRGCIVTIDAMGCQRKIAEQIIDGEADYILAVKRNQERLHQAFQRHFPAPKLLQLHKTDADIYMTDEKAHGREELRQYIVFETFDEFVDLSFEWKGMKSIGIAISTRTEPGHATDIAVRYYISSAQLSAKQFGEAVRSHWGVESSLHWCLDVAMYEDDCRIRRGEGAENMAAIRQVALNLLRKESSMKAGIKRKRQRAGRNEDYLSKVIEAA